MEAMTRQELLGIIDQAEREGWKELDLQGKQIEELPSEIGRLTGLKRLDLSSNQLVAAPPEIGQLTSLTELSLSNNHLATLPPEIGQLINLTTLVLITNRLTTIPPEIGQLSSLTELHLSRNRLAALPPEISQLTKLMLLDLSYNRLKVVPPDICQLTSLIWLRLSNNQLTTMLPEISQLDNLIELFLSNNWLTALPSEIGQLTSLTWLHLSHNSLVYLPLEIGQLSNLAWLHLSHNQLTALPPDIGQLINLTQLDLRGNQLIALPSEIGQLTRLTLLELSHNQLTATPPEIGQLTNLTQIGLNDNKLEALSPEIGQLINLTELNLSNNRLTTVPPEVGCLTNLTRFYLYGNNLMDLPLEIGQLTRLTEFSLAKNQLKTLPSEIGHLTHLVRIHLYDNKLVDLPPKIGQLTNLIRLDLNNNQLTSLPPEIGQLTSLTQIFLWDNRLTTLPTEIGRLSNLTELFLSENYISTLPSGLRQLYKLEKLHLYNNPLPLAPELLGDWHNPGDPQTILSTYFAASRPLREAKLLLIGEGGVGKTSLVERLLWDSSPSDSGKTIGVDIHTCFVDNGRLAVGSDQVVIDGNLTESSKQPTRPQQSQPQTSATPETAVSSPPTHSEQSSDATTDPGPIRLNIWDFGGQEIYHATHQFFLTYRSLYLLVIEARKDEEANRLDYWLRHIQSFAGDAPVILVINKIDQHQPTLDERGLMLRYPTIRAIIHTSCTEGSGIDQLHQTIVEMVATLPHVNDWIPLDWFAVKEKLAALDKDFLPYDTYIDLCLEAGIEHEPAQRTLARFLHDLGIALNFQDDRRLAGTNILNPEWVTGGIYKILDDGRLQGKGILHLNDLDCILGNSRRYPYHKHPFLLDIMSKFELCVPLGDNNRYLIPGLLSKERPNFTWPTDAPVALEYRYAILPPAVLSRLMVRLHNHIWQGDNGDPIRWRNGLILARDSCRALVVADPTPSAPRITISLEGPFPHRRHLLASIRAELSVIHRSFAKLEAEEWVPLPGYSGKAIKYQALLNLEARGRTTYYHPDYDMDLDVALLLDGVESPATRRARRLLRERGHTVNIHVGDRYDLSGDFRQSILNLGSTMERVTQTINNKPAANAADRASLQSLIEQLLAQLAQTPSRAEPQAEAIARQAERLLTLASSSQPDPNLVEASSRQLEQAAETAAADMPALPAVVRQVVALVGRVAKEG